MAQAGKNLGANPDLRHSPLAPYHRATVAPFFLTGMARVLVLLQGVEPSVAGESKPGLGH